jgi:hypothetical protein
MSAGWTGRKVNHKTKINNSNDLVRGSIQLRNATDPSEGIRLIKAFLKIKERGWREKLIRFAEDLAKASS